MPAVSDLPQRLMTSSPDGACFLYLAGAMQEMHLVDYHRASFGVKHEHLQDHQLRDGDDFVLLALHSSELHTWRPIRERHDETLTRSFLNFRYYSDKRLGRMKLRLIVCLLKHCSRTIVLFYP